MTDHRVDKSILTAIEAVIQNALSIAKDIVGIFTLEVQLVGRRLASLVVLAIIALFFLIAMWFSVLGAVVVWLTSLHFGYVSAFLIVAAVNLLIALIIGYFIIRIAKNLKFNETHNQLSGRNHHE